jgi:enoyl-CoA hydratase/carnithine racemase
MTDIQIDLQPPIARVTLNRPDKRNAVSAAMWRELLALAGSLPGTAGTRAVLLGGAGTQAFSAGADIAEMQQNLQHPDRMREMQQVVQDAQEAWASLPLPTIAVIRGACTGGGCGLALCCDLRLATPDAFFAIPPARLGLAYSLADTKRLYDLVGPSRAKEILFTARRVDAAEALALGLVNEIVAADRLDAHAQALATRICANAGNSVRAAKTVVNMISAGTATETTASRRHYDESFGSAEFLEGARAFLEKREPRF